MSSTLNKQVEYLKTCVQPAQRSPEWYSARWERMTASDVATGLTITELDLHLEKQNVFCLKDNQRRIGRPCNPYQNVLSLIRKKVGQDSFTGNKFTRWGQTYEPIATEIYERRNNTKVHEFGLLLHPTYNLGASPDGITDDGTMLEIKCPYTREITGITPNYYWIQMQIQLEVCDLEICDFLECSFQQYPDKDAFDNDTEHDMEKGAFITNTDGSYDYIPIDYDIDTYLMEHGTTEQTITYWKLNKLSCVKVHRNREWFVEALPQLQKIWEYVEFYRSHGPNHIPSKITDLGKLAVSVGCNDKKKKQATPPKCMINNDSDDDDKATCLIDYMETEDD